MKRSFVCASLMLCTPLVSAAGNPWLAAPGSTSLQLSYIKQSTDEFNAGKTKGTLPAELSQTTTWVDVVHGITEDISVDARLGHASSEFSPLQEESGMTDTMLGVTWRFRDEFIHEGVPTLAVRVGVTLEGDYTAGQINSIGDGSSGLEASLIAGKVITPEFSIFGDVGYRYRGSGVDDDLFGSINGLYNFNKQLHANIGYSIVQADGDLDIGAPGFTGDFTRVAEDVEMFELGLVYQFARCYHAGISYGEVVDGRNTGLNEITGVSVGMTF